MFQFLEEVLLTEMLILSVM